MYPLLAPFNSCSSSSSSLLNENIHSGLRNSDAIKLLSYKQFNTYQHAVQSKINMSNNMYTFSANPVLGRRKERSPSPASNEQPASFVMNLAFRPKPSTETHHVAKRLRADPEAKGSSSRPEVNGPAVPTTNTSSSTTANAIAIISTAGARTQESFQNTAQRVRIQRKKTVNPFIPRKPRIPKATVPRPPKAAVFGEPSMALSDRAEANLSIDLGRPHTIITTSSASLPAAHVKNESKVARPRIARPIEAVKHCVCKKPYDSNMVVCTKCDKYFHPVCVGKGPQDARMYDDQQLSLRAYMRDAQEHGKTADFCCQNCDQKAKPKPSRRTYSWEEDQAEQRRRARVFQMRFDKIRSGGSIYVCDHCHQQIIGTRYECKFCEGFDLCRACFMNPGISSQHQHAEGDMMLV